MEDNYVATVVGARNDEEGLNNILLYVYIIYFYLYVQIVCVLFFLIISHMHVCTKPVLASLVSVSSLSRGNKYLLSLKYYMNFVTSTKYSLPFILFMSLGHAEYFRWFTIILPSESMSLLLLSEYLVEVKTEHDCARICNVGIVDKYCRICTIVYIVVFWSSC